MLTEKHRPRPARRLWRDSSVRRWLLAWLGAPVLAIINGAVRELAYKDQVGDSTDFSGTADRAARALLFGLQRRWPATTRDAVDRAIWAALSVLFEFGFGHYVEGDSWEDLLGTYDVTAGNLWILIPLWIAAGPAVVRCNRRRAAVSTQERQAPKS